jgi:hypothetical protein
MSQQYLLFELVRCCPRLNIPHSAFVTFESKVHILCVTIFKRRVQDFDASVIHSQSTKTAQAVETCGEVIHVSVDRCALSQ